MLHILCILLKIIGILILVILGLFVLLTGIVLFVPIRYQIDAKGKGTLQSLEVRIKFSWFLHLLSGYVFYADKKPEWQVRTAWKKWNVVKLEKMTETEIKPQNVKKTEEPTEKKEEKQFEKVVKQIETNQPKKQVKNKKKSFAEKCNKIFQKIKRTICNLCDKIKLLGDKKDRVLEFLQDELHQSAWKNAKREAVRLLKYLRPKKIKGRVHFGFSDPYLTGKTLAILSMWYPFYANTVSLEPDFEEAVLEGELSIKGCVRGFYFLFPVFNIIRSREIRQTYKHIREFQL
ncbi:hypothetical protein JCM31739_00320 [Faecalimonas canis]